MRIRKAVITAAARGQNALPLQTLVDRDGVQKSALRIILEEATSSGVEDVCVVVRPGDSLWSIAERVDPGDDPRPVVDEVVQARGDAPLVPGETILWPR